MTTLRFASCLTAFIALGGCAERAPACSDPSLVRNPAGECEPPPRADGGNEAGMDGGDPSADAGPCGSCPAQTPVCVESDEDTWTCEQCAADEDCSGDTPFCDASNLCVACVDAVRDCTDPDRPACVDGACTRCTDDAQCTDRESTTTCDEESGQCVQCTVDDESACGENSCDPALLSCTTTPRGMTGTCEPCLADSECIANHRCIPLTYGGTERGHYCMPTVPEGGCGTSENRPFTVALAARESRSGEMATIYCGINEALTTCEAVLAVLGATGSECTVDSACPDGGRCEPVGIDGTRRCTYSCGNELQCPSATDDPAVSTCNLGGDRYCGRTP